MVAENVVVAVGTEGASVAAGHLGHDGLALRRAGQAEDGAGKLERLLHRPDALVLVGRENLRRSPTATQSIGTVAPAGTAVFTCTTPLIRTSERASRRAPLKMQAPVAMKTESSTMQPERCA